MRLGRRARWWSTSTIRPGVSWTRLAVASGIASAIQPPRSGLSRFDLRRAAAGGRCCDCQTPCAGERDVYDVELPLIGDFNISNALAASGAAWALGVPGDRIASRFSTVPQVPGRLELVWTDPLVLRDYAHTPDALERALDAVRPFTPKRIIAVFGCGGDRDRSKRPEMGAIAEAKADVAIVTSDNPRTEDPERILDEIEAGMHGQHERIEDRRQAIIRALELARRGDVIVLAGKGHETYQIRGTDRLPFDEKQIVAELAPRYAVSAASPDLAVARGVAS